MFYHSCEGTLVQTFNKITHVQTWFIQRSNQVNQSYPNNTINLSWISSPRSKTQSGPSYFQATVLASCCTVQPFKEPIIIGFKSDVQPK